MSSEWSAPAEGGGQGASGPRAGFGTRLGAVLIDGVILLAVNLVVMAVLGRSAGNGVALLINLAYFVYFEGGSEGQTLGKKALKIRVVDAATGGEPGYGKAFLRYVGRIVSSIPCGLGYLWMLWDKERQTWHDKIATTAVVPAA